jgi:16S rRNA (uracil1498-N3)-methyltransferase
MVCELCQKPWWEQKWEKQLERSERKAIAGIKQAQLTTLPILAPPLGFEQCLQESLLQQPVVALEEGLPVGECLGALRQSSRIGCFVGPPGGFSPGEVELFCQHKVLSCRLGASRLRTELAATLLCAAALQSGL